MTTFISLFPNPSLHMFEVIKRDGMGHLGSWTLGDRAITTPNILFVSTRRFEALDEADVLLTNEPLQSEKPFILDSGSFFSHQEFQGDNVILPELIKPLGLEDIFDVKEAEPNDKNEVRRRNITIVNPSDDFEALKDTEAELFVVANAPHLIRKPRLFVRTIMKLRKSIGWGKMIYTPAIAEPQRLSFLAYCGIDILDSVSAILNARWKNFFTNSGKHHVENFGDTQDVPCHCRACEERGENWLIEHNYLSLLAELKMVKASIRRGMLRQHIESRIHSEAWMVSALRILDFDYYHVQEEHFPVRGGKLFANTRESLSRPDVRRFRERVLERYEKPSSAGILLLLPCSAKKPYSSSKSHRFFDEVIRNTGNPHAVHKLILTSPLGLVPGEMELFYPAQQYDIPVTGHWDGNEREMILGMSRSYLDKNKYDTIIDHSGIDFLGSDIDSETTWKKRPTSRESIKSLAGILAEKAGDCDKVSGRKRFLEDMANRAVFQFGEVGRKLLDGSEIKGRYPNLKIITDGKQIGMLTGERGMISLTLHGGEVLAREGVYTVEIDDFVPKGNIFAVGVLDASKDIRIGDDVAVVHKGELRAVGTAVMSPEEMMESKRGEAVRVRHKK